MKWLTFQENSHSGQTDSYMEGGEGAVVEAHPTLDWEGIIDPFYFQSQKINLQKLGR